MAIRATTSTSDRARSIDTRVTLVEHKLSAVQTDIGEHRHESRTNFAKLQASIDSLVGSGVGHRPDYHKVLAGAAAAVVIIAAIFGLAEWRVGNAVAPAIQAQQQADRIIEEMRRDQVDLRVRLGIETALREGAARERSAATASTAAGNK